MKGIFRLSPPRPRFNYTWDVRLLLEYLSTLEPLGSLTTKQLSFKLVSLLALTAAARAYSETLLVLIVQED